MLLLMMIMMDNDDRDDDDGQYDDDDADDDDVCRYSERPEPFYYISVPVKNLKSLHQALESFIAGETVDYTWEKVRRRR
jgi:hypothetical protein